MATLVTAHGLAPKIRNAVSGTRRLVSELLYERRYHVHTSGNLILADHDAENICYTPVNWRQLRRVLPPGSVTDRDVFIDLGSGKGRAVLEAAARYPFRKVIGVELLPELNEIARQNVAETTRKLRCHDIELVTADLQEYRIPDDVTVFFTNNAVRGAVFEAVLREVSASLARQPRPARLIYGNPLDDAAVLATGAWRKVRTVVPRRSHWPYGATCVYESVPQ
jgi:SAM-dependent methyltransferase